MNQMKISVIIPTYKPQDYLWECLDSVCGQTFPKKDYEVIVALNGCGEPYNTQIKSYMDTHSDVSWRYVRTDVPGVSNARNIGLDEAKGEYITFLDDDDCLSPSCLQALLSVSSRHCVGICHPQAFREDILKPVPYSMENVYRKWRGKVDGIAYTKVPRLFGHTTQKLFHRDVIGGRKYDTRFRNGEDSLFMFLVSDRFREVRLTPEDAVYYRRLRKESANYSMSAKTRVHNSARMILSYVRMYAVSPSSYSFRFFVTRVLGALKTMAVG